jgi:predicted benzoate:H+ symporter BenE
MSVMPQGRLLLPTLAMEITAMVFSIVALSILLAASHELNLSDRQTTTLIVGLYGIPGVLSLLLTFIFRQPLMFAWNIGGLIFLGYRCLDPSRKPADVVNTSSTEREIYIRCSGSW